MFFAIVRVEYMEEKPIHWHLVLVNMFARSWALQYITGSHMHKVLMSKWQWFADGKIAKNYLQFVLSWKSYLECSHFVTQGQEQ